MKTLACVGMVGEDSLRSYTIPTNAKVFIPLPALLSVYPLYEGLGVGFVKCFMCYETSLED